MSRSINDVLALREDISDFLVRLTKSVPGDPTATAIINLASILRDGRIEARNPHGKAKGMGMADDTQKAVCFSETPLQHIRDLVDIAGRKVNLEPYGLVFTKQVARSRGVLPVWYIDDRSGQSEAVQALLKLTWNSKEGFEGHPAARLFPFIETMGKGTDPTTGRTWRNEWSSAVAPSITPPSWH